MKKSKLYLFVYAALFLLFSCSSYKKDQPVNVPPVDYAKGKSFLNKNPDSAFYYFNSVVAKSNDSLRIAMAYTFMGIIQSDAGDYFGGQESFLSSLKHLDKLKKNNQEYLFSNYNELGSTELSLKNYDAAIEHYNAALTFVKDSIYRTVTLNNKAVAYQKKKQYEKALEIYRSIFTQSKTDQKEYARILSNMAHVKWLQNPRYNALPELWQALHIRKSEKDNWGLNASYAHLSDFYAGSQPDSAMFYAEKMYNIAELLNSPDDELEALQKLITLNPSVEAKKYFIRYQYLNDSLQTSRNNAKNQFALIRYDAAKNKADNLALQKENAEKNTEIVLQWAMFVGGSVLAIGLFVWYRKRKQLALREQKLETSKKVHDVVSNGIYRVMSKLEHEDNIDKEQLLDEIDILYKQSRDISYEQPEKTSLSFHESIVQMLASFSSSTTTVSIVGNSEKIWNAATTKVQTEIKHVLQELMVNMKKHSRAENVVVRFSIKENEMKIQYSDDGIGLGTGVQYGNGLTNTENRIASIGGKITFDKTTTKGLNIFISIPIVQAKI